MLHISGLFTVGCRASKGPIQQRGRCSLATINNILLTKKDKKNKCFYVRVTTRTIIVAKLQRLEEHIAWQFGDCHGQQPSSEPLVLTGVIWCAMPRERPSGRRAWKAPFEAPEQPEASLFLQVLKLLRTGSMAASPVLGPCMREVASRSTAMMWCCSALQR